MSSTLGPSTVRLLPLGGLGEIGMNCLAIEQDDGILIVDCGTSFPHDDLGVDVVHPDFAWLLENVDRVRGVFLTHGHEDHIGGLPYLLDEMDVPIHGPKHALALVRRRLEEHEFRPEEYELREVRTGTSYALGPFEVEPIRVSHSIVEATALRIATRGGTILHTGDFNMDPDPPDGEPTDVERLRAIGNDGVELLLSDSTNVDTPERRGSEREVGAALARIVERARCRVVIAMFASNIQRLQLLGEIAAKSGRKICLLGRSLGTQRDIASALGRLSWPSNLVVAPDQAGSLPRERLLAIAGGSQAEPTSALVRLSQGAHPSFKLAEGDTVVFSSRIIPGNERPVLKLVNDLIRLGVELHSPLTDPDVHTSGHGGRSEQIRMIELTRPRAFLPVHGTMHHLVRHAELASSLGIERVVVAENGHVVRYGRESGLARDGRFASGAVAVAQGGEPLPDEVLRKRADLGRFGFASVTMVLDRRGDVAAAPSVTARGVPRVDDHDAALRSVAREVVIAFERVRHWHKVDLQEELRRAARRRLGEISGTRPIVEVHVIHLDANR